MRNIIPAQMTSISGNRASSSGARPWRLCKPKWHLARMQPFCLRPRTAGAPHLLFAQLSYGPFGSGWPRSCRASTLACNSCPLYTGPLQKNCSSERARTSLPTPVPSRALPCGLVVGGVPPLSSRQTEAGERGEGTGGGGSPPNLKCTWVPAQARSRPARGRPYEGKEGKP